MVTPHDLRHAVETGLITLEQAQDRLAEIDSNVAEAVARARQN